MKITTVLTVLSLAYQVAQFGVKLTKNTRDDNVIELIRVSKIVLNKVRNGDLNVQTEVANILNLIDVIKK